MAFQSPQNNFGFQVTVVLGAFSLICLITALFFNMNSGEAISFSAPGAGEFSQSFESNKKNQVYYVQMRANTGSLQVNSGWSEAQIEIADEGGTPLFAFGGDFWRAAGRDSDGPWTERKNSNTMKITLREPGTYKLNVDFSASASNPGQLSIALYPKRASSLPFFWIGVLAFIGAIAVGYFSSQNIIAQKIRDLDYEF